jgi:hypothetical protein
VDTQLPHLNIGYGVAVSASGQYQTAVVNGGFIYTSLTPYSTLAVSNQLTVTGNTTVTGNVTVGNVGAPYVPSTSTTTGALVGTEGRYRTFMWR